MKLEQNISKGYEPIEPESNKEKLRKLSRKAIPWIAGYAIFTILNGVTILNSMEQGKTKKEMEKEFHSGKTFYSKALDYSRGTLSKPGRELGYFLYKKEMKWFH